MAKTRILLTGADGLIGSHILDQLLGHDTVSIRSIVGTQEAASSLLRQYPRVSASSLEVQIASEQDLKVPGVFDELLSDDTKPFQAVVYTSNATPSNEADCLARYINLETETIINFLTSVNDVARGVSRVVIVTTLTSFARWLAVPQHERYLPESSADDQVDPENMLATCQASDNVVHDAVSKWAREAGLRFDIVWISAPSVYGPSIRPLNDSSNLLEANRRIWNICYQRAGNIAETSPYGLAHFLDVRDLASATIRGLFTGRAANKRFMISAGVMPSTSEIAYQLVTRFPDLENSVHIGGRPSRAHGLEDSSLLFLDSYLIQSVLGISQFYSAEQTLIDTTQQIMDLMRRKSWRSITQS